MYPSTPQPTIAMKNKDRAIIALRTDEFLAKGGKIKILETRFHQKGARKVTSEVESKSIAYNDRKRKARDAEQKRVDALRFHRS